jgi:hypothetical protein
MDLSMGGTKDLKGAAVPAGSKPGFRARAWKSKWAPRGLDLFAVGAKATGSAHEGLVDLGEGVVQCFVVFSDTIGYGAGGRITAGGHVSEPDSED